MNVLDLDSIANLAAMTGPPSLDMDKKRTTTTKTTKVDLAHNERARRDAYVMIVDDESANIDVVQAYLEEEGFGNFVTTTDSTSVVEMVRRNSVTSLSPVRLQRSLPAQD